MKVLCSEKTILRLSLVFVGVAVVTHYAIHAEVSSLPVVVVEGAAVTIEPPQAVGIKDGEKEMEQFFAPEVIIIQSVSSSQAKRSAEKSDLLTLFKACCEKESQNNPRAVGDKGKAVGIAQMWRCVVDDVNSILGEKRYSYADRWSVVKSREIFVIYLGHYGRKLEKATGHKPTTIQLARIWNGGPDGWKKWRTQSYGRDVMKVMSRLTGDSSQASKSVAVKKAKAVSKPQIVKPAKSVKKAKPVKSKQDLHHGKSKGRAKLANAKPVQIVRGRS